MTWVANNWQQIVELTLVHLRLSLLPIVLGFVLAIPLGWVAHRYRLTRGLVLTVVGLLYTIPSLALFVILPPLLGHLPEAARETQAQHAGDDQQSCQNREDPPGAAPAHGSRE